jgi:antitoxin MazE
MYIQLNNGRSDMLKVKVQKWGNSLGVRIPQSIAKTAGIESDSEVEMEIKENAILLKPIKKYSLESLISKISGENLHKEIDTGSPVGNEIW